MNSSKNFGKLIRVCISTHVYRYNVVTDKQFILVIIISNFLIYAIQVQCSQVHGYYWGLPFSELPVLTGSTTVLCLLNWEYLQGLLFTELRVLTMSTVYWTNSTYNNSHVEGLGRICGMTAVLNQVTDCWVWR